MPLVVLCGYPCSGKTTYAAKLRDYLVENGCKSVKIVNEESAQINKRLGYQDSASEKNTRGVLKSAVDHALSVECIVILDSMNYIKGFRYELHCIARTLRTPQCTIWIQADEKLSSNWNQARLLEAGDDSGSNSYPPSVYEELMRRFEAPIEKNRWDAPLFLVDATPEANAIDTSASGKAATQNPAQGTPADMVFSSSSWRPSAPSSNSSISSSSFKRPAATAGGDGSLTFSGTSVVIAGTGAHRRGYPAEDTYRQILDQLHSTPSLQPNSSTMAVPHGSADVLADLDRMTQQVVSAIIAHQRVSSSSHAPIIFAEFDRTLGLHRFVALAELQRHRRQFISLNSKRPPGEETQDPASKIGSAFLDFLATQL